MKFRGSMLVAVAMMVGSVSAMGCKSQEAAPATQDAIAPDETPDTAPTSTAAADAPDTNEELRGGGGVHFYAPHGPPALRVEERGRAPSDRHFWTPGYYRWNGREHIWNGGRWEARRDGYEYAGPRWFNAGNRWEYRPGVWHRR